MSFDYDLFVIGAGSGGIAAARRAASHGARVAIAERDSLGGTCVNRGCVPKKLFVYASRFAEQFQLAQDYGWSVEAGEFDWPRFIAAKDQEIGRLNQVYQRLLEDSGVTLLRGLAQFCDRHTLEVDGQTVTAEKILIAVGGRPRRPEIPGIEHAWVSDDIFHVPQQPRRIAIIGGGYIGVEFAGILQGLGSQVSLVVRDRLVLNHFDQDIREHVQLSMASQGVEIHTDTEAKAIERHDRGLTVWLTGDEPQSLEVDGVLVATGRVAHLGPLRLEAAGVTVERGAIAVDAYSRTSQANIFAVGDCTNRRNLTPVAIAEGRAFADTEFNQQPHHVSYHCIPSAVFSHPEAATVGLTEAEARAKIGDAVRCYRSQFRPLLHTLGHTTQVLLKLVVDGQTDKVLGAHMVGEAAAEIIQSLAVALRLGATRSDLNQTIGIHPSTGEEFFSMH